MSTLEALAARWRQEAELLERYGSTELATACRLHADELEAAAAELADEMLTLEAAAAESGYSTRRLREMLADGTLPQAGRKGAPRVRRRDLPRKPGSTAASGYDPATDAQTLLGRMAS